jgi:hypothetical protein
MSATKETMETAKPRMATAASATVRAAVPDERARARAYLDLWERHLVHAAVNGPVFQGRPPAR